MRITHPFHPLFDQQFLCVSERSSGQGDRVWYERTDGSVASIWRAWTDLAGPDPFAAVAEGKAHFRPEDLADLAALVVAIREGGGVGGKGDV